MRNFQKLPLNVNVAPLAHAVQRQPWLWGQHAFRQEYAGSPHTAVDDIWLRFSDDSKCDPSDVTAVINDSGAIWHDAAKALPQAQALVLTIMAAVGAFALDRLLITRLPPGGIIAPHADIDGEYVKRTNCSRYHCVLQGLPGSLYTCGDETVEMLTGEVWWFNPWLVHEVRNCSKDDRIHLLVDVQIWP